MGSQMTHMARFVATKEALTDPEVTPRADRPPTFDPVYGFPNGRKERKMEISWQEMEDWCLSPDERDYCAHLLVPWLKCRRSYAPFAGYFCADYKHHYETCEYEDHIMRLKEYERERRLLKRMRRKKLQVAKEALE